MLGSVATQKAAETLACLEVAALRAKISSDTRTAALLDARITAYKHAQKDALRVVAVMATLARAVEADCTSQAVTSVK